MTKYLSMWEVCDEALLQVLETPGRKEEIFAEARNDWAKQGVLVVALRCAMIPEAERGEWRDAAKEIAQEFIPDGVEHWLAQWEQELLAQIGTVHSENSGK